MNPESLQELKDRRAKMLESLYALDRVIKDLEGEDPSSLGEEPASSSEELEADLSSLGESQRAVYRMIYRKGSATSQEISQWVQENDVASHSSNPLYELVRNGWLKKKKNPSGPYFVYEPR